MKSLINIIVFLILTSNAFGQSFKDEISIVQFSAPFTKEAEISLKIFDDSLPYVYSFIICYSPTIDSS